MPEHLHGPSPPGIAIIELTLDGVGRRLQLLLVLPKRRLPSGQRLRPDGLPQEAADASERCRRRTPSRWSVRLPSQTWRRAASLSTADILAGVNKDLGSARKVEMRVRMDVEASNDEIDAVRKVLGETGLDIPVKASYVRLSSVELPWYMLLVLPLLGTYGKGFVEKLGQQHAEALQSFLASLVRRLWKARRSSDGAFEIEDQMSGIRFHITRDLPDTAFFAMQDIDPTLPEHEGNVFIFDAETGRWKPIL